MTTLDEITKAVSEWATAHQDALPEWPTTICTGELDDGTLVAVGFTPAAVEWGGGSVEQRPMIVYRLQRDGVYCVTPMSPVSARDEAYVRSVHTRTEWGLGKMRERHAGTA